MSRGSISQLDETLEGSDEQKDFALLNLLTPFDSNAASGKSLSRK
jgi:hypothetical protein